MTESVYELLDLAKRMAKAAELANADLQKRLSAAGREIGGYKCTLYPLAGAVRVRLDNGDGRSVELDAGDFGLICGWWSKHYKNGAETEEA